MASAENFSALRAATACLADSAKPLGLAELIDIDQANRLYADAFIHQYVHTPELDAEIEAQIWQTLYAYLQALDQAYLSVYKTTYRNKTVSCLARHSSGDWII